ncbi:T7SS effector LXG polymorphic toxin [Shouchella lonarensis]|uniref:LXG domain of WXG superfamily protein n=1 Tax=Shouchella lonarensis TaxID=1464122 RepID=A0A1G6ILR6_9BACI|nr:T7SS effector LXG polymorphic toxin [Shouchella lonarensis]SDC06706.1 LXG domain of WXG superfamily protein [Shouchella lonarensis]
MLTFDFAEIHDMLGYEIVRRQHYIEALSVAAGAMERIANCEDVLQGQGGDGVRALYVQVKLPAIKKVIDFNHTYIEVLSRAQYRLADLDNNNALWDEEFITHDLKNQVSTINRETRELERGFKQVSLFVSDLVSLGHLNAQNVYQTSGEARDRIKKLSTLMENFESTVCSLNAVLRDRLHSARAAKGGIR